MDRLDKMLEKLASRHAMTGMTVSKFEANHLRSFLQVRSENVTERRVVYIWWQLPIISKVDLFYVHYKKVL